MRDFSRIQNFTLVVEMVWLAYPDLRFGQMAQAIAPDFYQEDGPSLDVAKNMINQLQGKVINNMAKNNLPVNVLTEDGINTLAWLQFCLCQTLPEIRTNPVNFSYCISQKKLSIGSLADYSQETINYIATIMEVFNTVN